MVTVFLNGRFVDGPAQVSAFDAGFQHGVGLFETFLGGCARPDSAGDDPASRGAWAVHLDEHLDRLHESARALSLASVLHTGPLGEAALRTIARSGLAHARVRLTVTGGDLNLLNRPLPGGGGSGGAGSGGAGSGGAGSGAAGQDPTVLIVAQPATRYPAAMIASGVSATIAGTRVSPLDESQGHKTLNYWWRLRALQQAAAEGAGEALVFSAGNHLVGGCVSSAAIIKGDTISLPIARGEEREVADEATRQEGGRPGGAVLPSPVLPGITRAWLMRTAEGLGLRVRRKMIGFAEIQQADELVLTNSSWGVLAVTRLPGCAIGTGERGPIAAQLAQAWEQELTLAAAAGA
jgi:branched-subunit amino acid aminotransferase/4-amino-4-deoxychorismate lyase